MKKVVIKLGGSLISLSDDRLIDFNYLENLKKVLLEFEDTQFAVVIGGGYLCRKYQKFVGKENNLSDRSLDWLGIATINLNAECVKCLWEDITEDEVIKYHEYDESYDIEFNKKVLVGAANSPGHSSDTDAVVMADKIGTQEIYRLTDVEAIYTKDPEEHPEAEILTNLTWDEYFEVLGIKEFTPGGHYPIDPIAAREAKSLGQTFKVMGGRNLDNFRESLLGNSFKGTTVSG